MKVLKKWIAGLVIIGMITGIFADSKNMISTSYAAEECGVSEQSEVTGKQSPAKNFRKSLPCVPGMKSWSVPLINTDSSC